jgi:hypothetical protein
MECVFRSNPAYELAAFDRLSPDQQELLKDLTKDPDFYGVLVPRTAGALAVKSVCRDTALLVHTMLQPGPLPHYVRRTAGGLSNQAVAQLVLDGVLDIEHEGRFVSGSEAYSLIYDARPGPEPQGFLPRLSQAALEYAQGLAIDDVARLSLRLYLYNRIPLTPYWTRRLPSENAVSEFLGISDSAIRTLIRRNWRQSERSAPFNGWFQWQSRASSGRGLEGRQGYKLYVSPRPEALPCVFRAVVEVLDDAGAHHFKVGCDPPGLLRPDKLILYFHDFEPLERVGREIARRVTGCAAHGVPFTAALTDDGLLSWGVDPIPEKGALRWQETESWRLWVTNRLAAALVAAGNNCPRTLQPWQFAIQRLRLENVDTATWAPTQGTTVAA